MFFQRHVVVHRRELKYVKLPKTLELQDKQRDSVWLIVDR
jgi:hypothetical protein